jgi:hypothetical protein
MLPSDDIMVSKDWSCGLGPRQGFNSAPPERAFSSTSSNPFLLHPRIPVVYMIEIPHGYDEETTARRGGENPHGSASAASMTYLRKAPPKGTYHSVPLYCTVQMVRQGSVDSLTSLTAASLSLSEFFVSSSSAPHAHPASHGLLAFPKPSPCSPVSNNSAAVVGCLSSLSAPVKPTRQGQALPLPYTEVFVIKRGGAHYPFIPGCRRSPKVPKGCLVPS